MADDESRHRLLSTEDGRELDLLVYGADDPATTVVFHDGTPTAAVVSPALAEVATGRGIRVVTWSRPGYATSTPQPGRTVADVVTDGRTVLDSLGVDTYVVLGWSGGGPHALAHATLDAPRCQAAATIGSPAPYEGDRDWMTGMGADNVAEFDAALAGAGSLTDFLGAAMAAGIADVTAAGIVASLGGLVSRSDVDAMTDTQAEHLAASLRRAVSTGIAGWRDDDLAFVRDWDVDLASIGVPVTVWQGATDLMVPPSHGRRLAACIPTATLRLEPDEGHLSWELRLGEILDDLLGHADR